MNILQLLQDKQWRKHNIQYWLLDPFWGSLDYLCYYSFRLLPLNIPCKIGAFLGSLAGAWRFKSVTQRADNNLKFLQPGLSDAERKSLVQQMWQNIGQTTSEYPIADLLWQDGRVEVKNAHYVFDYQSKGVPMIFVTVHLANWEVISGACKDNNIALLSLYQPQPNRFVNKLAENSRSKSGIQLVPADPNALRMMYKHLANGGALWFALDEYDKHEQVLWPPLGRNLDTHNVNAVNVIRLAERFNAVIIPYKTERQKDSHFTVTISEPLSVNNNSEEILTQLSQLAQTWILEHPEDWYMLHKRF